MGAPAANAFLSILTSEYTYGDHGFSNLTCILDGVYTNTQCPSAHAQLFDRWGKVPLTNRMGCLADCMPLFNWFRHWHVAFIWRGTVHSRQTNA